MKSILFLIQAPTDETFSNYNITVQNLVLNKVWNKKLHTLESTGSFYKKMRLYLILKKCNKIDYKFFYNFFFLLD